MYPARFLVYQKTANNEDIANIIANTPKSKLYNCEEKLEVKSAIV